jgi:hypothetical protein
MDENWDADPFEVVTSEARVAILRALAERIASAPAAPSMAFADLRSAAGVGDSGNFNYHLDRLRPEFVRRTDDGYRLTPAGIELVGTLRVGVSPAESRGPVALDRDCGLCGTSLAATYEDGLLAVTCENDHAQPRGILPPNAVAGRDLADAAELLMLRTVQQGELAGCGICPVCYGEMDVAHDTAAAAPPAAQTVFRGTCGDCGMVYGGPTGVFLLRRPAVVSFCRDHGVTITDGGYWEIDLPLTGGSVIDRNPLRVSVEETLEGERLRLVVDGDLAVVERRRERIDRPAE